MRTFKPGFLLAPLALAPLTFACMNDHRPAMGPAPTQEPPQRAFNDPSAPAPLDATVSPQPLRRSPYVDPTPQRPTLERGPQPFPDAESQKSLSQARTNDNRVLAKTEKSLTDAEILGVAVAANDGEVMMAEMAIRKAIAPEVKEFAAMMKSQHSAFLQKAKALQMKTKVESTDSDVSTYLRNDVDRTLKELREKEGGSFDRSYMVAQAKAHKDVLSAIDNRLTPSATNGEVKALVIEMRRRVSDHLTKAEEIHKKLDPASTAKGQAGATIGLGIPEPRERRPKEPSGKHLEHEASTPDPQPVEKR